MKKRSRHALISTFPDQKKSNKRGDPMAVAPHGVLLEKA